MFHLISAVLLQSAQICQMSVLKEVQSLYVPQINIFQISIADIQIPNEN